MPERYRERSPIQFMGNIRGRVLIVQGLRDPNVTPENVRAAAALQASNVEFQTLVFRTRATDQPPEEPEGAVRAAVHVLWRGVRRVETQ